MRFRVAVETLQFDPLHCDTITLACVIKVFVLVVTIFLARAVADAIFIFYKYILIKRPTPQKFRIKLNIPNYNAEL
jgi:hypothetical protein